MKRDEKTNRIVNKLHSEEIELYQIDLNQLEDLEHRSILNHAPLLMKRQMQGNPLIDELSIWSMLSTQGLIEQNDMKLLKQTLRNTFKYILFFSLLTGFSNRILTKKLIIRQKRFLDYNIFMRMFCRCSIIGVFSYFLYNKVFDSFVRIHYYMNYKYSERYRKYNIEGEPLIMNPSFLNHPSYSSSEIEIRKALYDKTKSQQMQIIFEEKEIEKMLAKQKKS